MRLPRNTTKQYIFKNDFSSPQTAANSQKRSWSNTTLSEHASFYYICQVDDVLSRAPTKYSRISHDPNVTVVIVSSKCRNVLKTFLVLVSSCLPVWHHAEPRKLVHSFHGASNWWDHEIYRPAVYRSKWYPVTWFPMTWDGGLMVRK